jgi:hypothetical protein
MAFVPKFHQLGHQLPISRVTRKERKEEKKRAVNHFVATLLQVLRGLSDQPSRDICKRLTHKHTSSQAATEASQIQACLGRPVHAPSHHTPTYTYIHNPDGRGRLRSIVSLKPQLPRTASSLPSPMGGQSHLNGTHAQRRRLFARIYIIHTHTHTNKPDLTSVAKGSGNVTGRACEHAHVR